MDKQPITNNSAMPIYVHGVMIPPGETRHFDPSDVPAQFHQQPEPDEPPPAANPLAELLDAPVKEIIAALPGLAEEAIGDLETWENAAEKPRSKLLEAIAAERLKRAMPSDGAEGTSDGATGDA